MIGIEQLKFAYPGGEFRLSVPELRVDTGETVAIVGPSGSGKSTLLNLIAGVLRPGAGRIEADETEVSALSDRRGRAFRARTIGFVFQDFGLLDYLSARDNIMHPYRICAPLRLTAEVRVRVEALAARLGVFQYLDRRPEALSQGERQRVAICRALLPGPRVILADEATGNLDPANKDAILDLLFEAVETDGATLVAVTHDHELLPRFDRVIDFRDFIGCEA
jgi:putative ABC transport system ATP-binding protein